ncbi:DUF222 domain-containing protein [Cryobacterium sp. TMS1-20-1]|uniref:DUF222 domain-containing protein n=1 Tax=Cryobacterium sp. TMS1-20-1 TaxID=1259223 RepID=UPI00106B461D|nr:DUF222 domain-containing protein [Cryobacterium sp. TMS1-20-1]TFC77619.1 DUF222 domain-containing protein [Cryobacterium sp. TMS1-20-1]
MSQSGDTPQPGRVDPFFAAHGYPPSTLEERAEFEVFWAQCQADWRCEIAEGLGEFAPYEVTDPVDLEPVSPAPVSPAPVSLAPVSPTIGRPELIDGPTIPADLDLTEVFGAVPPEHLFDEDLREEFLYTNYLADNYLPVDFIPDGCTADECTTDGCTTDGCTAGERHTDPADADRGEADRGEADPADADPADPDPDQPGLAPGGPADVLSPFQRHQAQFVDRVLYLEKVIAWAQASKAEVLTEAWDYTTNSAETGRPQAGPQHEHDWDATFAAQQGLVAEMACALRIPAGTASGLLHQSRVLVESRPQTLTALRTGEISLRHAQRLLDQLDSVSQPARAELEAVLLPHAKRLTPTQFDGKARKLRERFHPDSITVRRARCLADRRVQFFPDQDGMATLWLRAAGDDLQGVLSCRGDFGQRN